MKTTFKNSLVAALAVGLLVGGSLSALGSTVIVDDSWLDADRASTGPLQADWWSSSSSSGNSVEDGTVGELGVVTGGSGRGIHGTFTPQTLAIGDGLKVTYSFTTPATVGNNKSASFKVALMDFNDPGLAANLTSSSGSPQPLYFNLPGYMSDFDVNMTDASDNITIREHNVNATGRFLGTTGEWSSFGGSPNADYSIAPTTQYVGVFEVTRTGADSMDISSSLSQGATLLDSHTETDSSGIANNFGMFGLWANSSTFGSTTANPHSDNGIDLTNFRVELISVTVPPPPTNGTACVADMTELNAAIGAANPGDTIFMCNGTWDDADILFDTDGLPGQPITLQASTPGQTILTGQSKLRIAGDYLVVKGLHFKDGFASDGDHVIQFRNGSGDLANNSRLTECAITDFNPASSSTDYKWVSVYGLSNRVDHCAFTGMNHDGVTLTVWLGTGAPANHTRIDNNYFADHASGGGVNGWETIRIGTSTRSMQPSEAIVESNYFYQCDGEIEIISSKSGGNIYRYNTFEDCEGQLTLRHGNNNVVEGNFFLGQNNAQSSGVRVIGEDHVVINNYFENLRGTGNRGALVMMNGIPSSPLSGYFQVQRALVAFNTFFGCRETFVIGRTATGATLPPLDCVIANNIVKGSNSPLIEYQTTPINMQYEGNIFHGASLGITQPPGITIVDPQLATGPDGLQRPTSPGSPAIDAAAGSYSNVVDDMDGDLRTVVTQDIGADEVAVTVPVRGPLTIDDVGPRWMHPNTLIVRDLDVDTTNAHLQFDDETGLAPYYYVQEAVDLETTWSNVMSYAPLDYTGGIFEVSVPLPPGSSVMWRVTTD